MTAGTSGAAPRSPRSAFRWAPRRPSWPRYSTWSATETTWSFLRSGAVSVLPIDDPDLPALESLMRRYADHPMDFADAKLVHLAHREPLATVFTIDQAEFETYRIGSQRRFRVVPGR